MITVLGLLGPLWLSWLRYMDHLRTLWLLHAWNHLRGKTDWNLQNQPEEIITQRGNIFHPRRKCTCTSLMYIVQLEGNVQTNRWFVCTCNVHNTFRPVLCNNPVLWAWHQTTDTPLAFCPHANLKFNQINLQWNPSFFNPWFFNLPNT